MNRRLVGELSAVGHPPEHCAWFRTADSMTFETVLAFMEGMAALTAFSPMVGEAIDSVNELLVPNNPAERHDLTHHVAIAVAEDVVEVWSGDRHRVLGCLLATFHHGCFRGHFHHYPERVDLTLDGDGNGRIFVTGSWTHLNDECLHTARAAVALATGPAH